MPGEKIIETTGIQKGRAMLRGMLIVLDSRRNSCGLILLCSALTCSIHFTAL